MDGQQIILDDTASVISEITYAGHVVQVREDPFSPRPGKIRFLLGNFKRWRQGPGRFWGIGMGSFCMGDGGGHGCGCVSGQVEGRGFAGGGEGVGGGREQEGNYVHVGLDLRELWTA